MPYAEAMFYYGSDKPDMRINLKFIELTDLMRTEEFKVFRGAADMKGGRVVALRVPNGAKFSRKEIDEYTKFVGIYGAKGLAYIKVNDVSNLSNGEDSGLQSPIVKFLSENALKEIIARTGAQNGDIIFFGADKAKVVNEAIGALRIKSVWNTARKTATSWTNGDLCGSSISRCSNTTKTRSLGSHAPSVHLAQARS